MKKKIYQSPTMKVVKVAAHRMLCNSEGEGNNSSMSEVELDNSSFIEQ